MKDAIFKIMSRALWESRGEAGELPWAPIDHQDGFIHLSSAEQLRETAQKHFGEQRDLVLLWVDPRKVADLRWEISRGGQRFPHAYGAIPAKAIVRVEPFVGDTPGCFQWPSR